MARYTGAKLRITRRLGDLPGLTSKKSKLKILLEKVALDKDLMQFDGIHPNQKAQKIIADQVKKELLNIFK